MYHIPRKSLVMFCLTATMLLLLLAACGSAGTGSTKTGGTGATSPTPTATQTYSAANGCPSETVMTNEGNKPNVTIKPTDIKDTVVVHNGNVVEIRLPFGHQWSGPQASQGVLQLQGSGGFALKSDKVCVWRYVAKNTGTTTLDFSSRALCKPGQFCPMYVMKLPFKIEVQK